MAWDFSTDPEWTCATRSQPDDPRDRVSIVDLASQLGHSPTMTLNTYAHVIAELRGAPPRSAEDEIRQAGAMDPSEDLKSETPRDSANAADPKRTPEGLAEANGGATNRASEPKPTGGLEPPTPSLRVKCSTS